MPASEENIRGFLPGLGSGLASPLNSQQLYGCRINPTISVRELHNVFPAYEGLVGGMLGLQTTSEKLRYVINQFDPSVLYLGWHATEQVEVLPRMRWLPPVLTRLEELRCLSAGWDSPNSLPIREDAVQSTLKFLWQVMQPVTPPPSIVPLGSGGLQIEWHRAGWNVEIEFDEDACTPIYVHELATNEEQEGPDAEALFNQLQLSYRLVGEYDPANGLRR